MAIWDLAKSHLRGKATTESTAPVVEPDPVADPAATESTAPVVEPDPAPEPITAKPRKLVSS